MRRIALGAVLVALTPAPSPADCMINSDTVGYTIVARKTIVASIKEGVRKDGFDGCNYNHSI
jgi:hypothetical protein